MTILFAAGSDGRDLDRNGLVDLQQLGGAGAAKNAITVGASESCRPEMEMTYGIFGFSGPPLRDDRMANRPDGLVAFSNRGPIDGRYQARSGGAGNLHPVDTVQSTPAGWFPDG